MNADMKILFQHFLVNFQRSSLRQTGRRPLVALDSGVDEDMLMPGCRIEGYSYWQPMLWPETPDLGGEAAMFDSRILDMLTICRYYEVDFTLPVPSSKSPISYLYNRSFLTLRNTMRSQPSQRLKEAVQRHESGSHFPLCVPFAVADPYGESAVLTLGAEDAMVYLYQPERGNTSVSLDVTIDILMPYLK